jgi:hypothetical protein
VTEELLSALGFDASMIAGLVNQGLARPDIRQWQGCGGRRSDAPARRCPRRLHGAEKRDCPRRSSRTRSGIWSTSVSWKFRGNEPLHTYRPAGKCAAVLSTLCLINEHFLEMIFLPAWLRSRAPPATNIIGRRRSLRGGHHHSR